MLHIRCGDDILEKLREAGWPGEFIRWADALCQGPVRAGLDPDAWRRMRARHAETFYGMPFETGMEFLAEQDRNLATFEDHDEVLLWFEHDLFDQIVLIYLLQWFSKRDLSRTTLFLICPDRHLGNMSTAELATLYGTQHEVTEAERAAATGAWDAFCAPDPSAIEAVIEMMIHEKTPALPHLAPALQRHLEEYPSLANGLGRTEQTALEVIAGGISEPATIFHRVQMREERFWLGDSMFWPYLEQFASARAPLLKIKGTGPWPSRGSAPSDRRVFLTATGDAVLREKADHLQLNGIDRWLGGVHLRGTSPWRWDSQRKRLAEAR